MNAITAAVLLRPLDQPTGRAPNDRITDRLRRIGRQVDATGIACHNDDRAQQSERAAEAALLEHQRRVRAASYVPLAANLFRVH